MSEPSDLPSFLQPPRLALPKGHSTVEHVQRRRRGARCNFRPMKSGVSMSSMAAPMNHRSKKPVRDLASCAIKARLDLRSNGILD